MCIYLCCIFVLVIFGVVYFIFLWDGDILFSYVVGVFGLLIVFWGKLWWILFGVVVLLGLGFLFEVLFFFGVVVGVGIMGLLGLYLCGIG